MCKMYIIVVMKMAAFKVAALDRFPEVGECRPGGNAMNQSVRFRQMGWEASFVGAVGTDGEGELLVEALRAYGVDCTRASRVSGETASNRLTIDAQGERHEAPGAWQGGVYETYRLSDDDWAFLETADLWVSHANHTDYLEALERKNRQFFAVDFLHLRDWELLNRSLDVVDIAFFGGTPDMEGPLADIAKARDALIVLTLGSEGSIAFQGDRVFRQSALPLDKVVDTTGCGDAFQAAFTDCFYRFLDVPKALVAGAREGQKAAASLGAMPWPDALKSDAQSIMGAR